MTSNCLEAEFVGQECVCAPGPEPAQHLTGPQLQDPRKAARALHQVVSGQRNIRRRVPFDGHSPVRKRDQGWPTGDISLKRGEAPRPPMEGGRITTASCPQEPRDGHSKALVAPPAPSATMPRKPLLPLPRRVAIRSTSSVRRFARRTSMESARPSTAGARPETLRPLTPTTRPNPSTPVTAVPNAATNGSPAPRVSTTRPECSCSHLPPLGSRKRVESPGMGSRSPALRYSPGPWPALPIWAARSGHMKCERRCSRRSDTSNEPSLSSRTANTSVNRNGVVALGGNNRTAGGDWARGPGRPENSELETNRVSVRQA